MAKQNIIPILYSSIKLNGMHYVEVNRDWTFQKHFHPNFEFLYCAKGELVQVINGELYNLQQGEAMIIKPNTIHSTECVLSDDTSLLCFHFDIDAYEVQGVFQAFSEPIIKTKFINSWFDRLIIEYRSELIEMDYSKQETTKDAFSKWKVSIRLLGLQTEVLKIICLLAEHLLQLHEFNVIENHSVTPTQYKIAMDIESEIQACYHLGIQVNELALKFNLNRSYLSNCFRAVFGISPRDYINSLRIEKAKKLLITTTFTTEEISEMLSYSSAAHFSKAFKSAMNVSPVQFRLNNKQINEENIYLTKNIL